MNCGRLWRCADRGLIGRALLLCDGCDGVRKFGPLHVYAAKHGSWFHGRRRIIILQLDFSTTRICPFGLLASERASSTQYPPKGKVDFFSAGRFGKHCTSSVQAWTQFFLLLFRKRPHTAHPHHRRCISFLSLLSEPFRLDGMPAVDLIPHFRARS